MGQRNSQQGLFYRLDRGLQTLLRRDSTYYPARQLAGKARSVLCKRFIAITKWEWTEQGDSMQQAGYLAGNDQLGGIEAVRLRPCYGAVPGWEPDGR